MTPVEERIDHEEAKRIAERHLATLHIHSPDCPTCSLARAYRDLLTEHFAREEEIKRLRGWPEIKVGAQSPPHSPVDRYRCENENCEIESVWEFRPDDYELDESIVNCPACGEEGELFFRWFRGGAALTPDEGADPPEEEEDA